MVTFQMQWQHDFLQKTGDPVCFHLAPAFHYPAIKKKRVSGRCGGFYGSTGGPAMKKIISGVTSQQ